MNNLFGCFEFSSKSENYCYTKSDLAIPCFYRFCERTRAFCVSFRCIFEATSAASLHSLGKIHMKAIHNIEYCYCHHTTQRANLGFSVHRHPSELVLERDTRFYSVVWLQKFIVHRISTKPRKKCGNSFQNMTSEAEQRVMYYCIVHLSPPARFLPTHKLYFTAGAYRGVAFLKYHTNASDPL